MAESKAVKVQASAVIIYVDGIITTLSGAITAANANPDTQYIISVQGDIAMNTTALSISNTAGVTITSDMNFSGTPFTLTKTYSGRHFIVNAGSSLTLENISLNGSGTFGGIDVRGVLVMMNGAAIQNCSAVNGGGVYGYAGSTITVAGNARITGNASTGTGTYNGGGGIYGVGSAITVAGTAQITGNTAAGTGTYNGGGGIYGYTNSKIIIAGGDISDNTGGNGGGIFITDGSQLTVITGNITGNKSTGASGTNGGGGICAGGSGSTVNVSGGLIYNNTAALNGGGIHGFTGSTITVGGAAMIVENAGNGGNGGGICIIGSNTSGACFVTVGGSAEIRGNTALSRGGGIATISSNSLYSTPHRITVEDRALVSGNNAVYGGGICAATVESMVTVNGGLINDNRATSNGGGIYLSSGSAITFGGASQITGNTADSMGGGIFMTNAKLDISGGTIGNNSASSIGGGICSYHDLRGASSTVGATYRSEITVTGGSITGNNAANGGGIGNANYFDSAGSNNRAECLISITAGDISGNTATENGGGIYNYDSSSSGGSKVALSNVSVTGGSITGNTAAGNGGGIFGHAYGSGTTAICVVTVDGGDITGNSAADGGGIFGTTSGSNLLNPDCRVIVNSGNVSNNTATGTGGGICGDALSKIIVTGGKIAANNASNGGGVYVVGTADISVGAGISDNKATNNGGGIYVTSQGKLDISDGSAITGNSAPKGDGGGVYTADTKYANLTVSGSTVFNGNSARAAYFFTGTPYPSIQSASVSIPGTYVLNNYDINYTAGTRIDFYTVTYDANGAAGTPPSDEIYPSGATVTVAGQNTLAMNGYAFAGWDTASDGDGELYETGDTFTITHDVKLYAQWTAVDIPAPPVYSVAYDANGGDGGYQDSGLTYGFEYTVLPLSDTGISNPGHIFHGWNTAPDASGTLYQAGNTFTITGDVILYARWLPETLPVPVTYTVTYDANGGYGGYSDAGLTLGLEYIVLPLSDTKISNPGHIFHGWNTAPNGSGTQYQDGNTITVSGNYTLYAQWRVISGGSTTSNMIRGESRRSDYQEFYQPIEIEENEVPLAGPEITKIEENHIPLTGAYSNLSFIGLACLLVIIGLICWPRRRSK